MVEIADLTRKKYSKNSIDLFLFTAFFRKFPAVNKQIIFVISYNTRIIFGGNEMTITIFYIEHARRGKVVKLVV